VLLQAIRRLERMVERARTGDRDDPDPATAPHPGRSEPPEPD
jgi:hypothetical protein